MTTSIPANLQSTIRPTSTTQPSAHHSSTLQPSDQATVYPTVHPTPRSSIRNISEKLQISMWTNSIGSLISNISSYNTAQYVEFLYDSQVRIGGMSQWQLQLKEELRLKSEKSPIQYLKFYVKDSLYSHPSFDDTVCRDPSPAASIVSRLVRYYESSPLGSSTSIQCDGNYWVLKDCHNVSALALSGVKLCINCTDPCSQETYNYNTVISYGCKSSGGCAHILEATFVNLFPPVTITDVSVVVTEKTFIGIIVDTSGYSIVRCTATASDTGGNTFSNINTTISNTATVMIFNLQPSTKYAVLCSTVSVSGSVLNSANLLNVSTICCKDLYISVNYQESRSAYNYFNFISVFVSSPPLHEIVVSVSLMSFPSNRSLCNSSTVEVSNSTRAMNFDRSLHISVKCRKVLKPADYKLWIDLSGVSAKEYEIVYLTSTSFRVVDLSLLPGSMIAPSFLSAVFVDSGVAVTISFSRQTNRANLPIVFNCSILLLFPGSSAARCQWVSDGTIIAYLIGQKILVIGDIIEIVNSTSARTLRSSCPTGFECNAWPSIDMNQSIIVQSPAHPVQPQVSISGPSVVGKFYYQLLVDLSSSTGDGGREWASVSISAQSTSPNANLDVPLADVVVMTEISLRNNSFAQADIPINLLEIGVQYLFYFTMCNWMQQCSSGLYLFFVSNYTIPSVRIIGPSVKTVHVYNTMTISAAIDFRGSSANYNYSILWFVSDEKGVVLPTVVNLSKDHSKFYLSSYSLSTNRVYQVQVVVVNSATAVSTSSIVMVTVHPPSSSDLIVIISQGALLTVAGRENFTLDGSMSYDRTLGYLQRQADTGLSYKWSCNPVSADFNSKYCEFHFLAVEGKHLSTVMVYPSPLSVGFVFEVVLTITKGRLSNWASILVNVSDKEISPCRVQINGSGVGIPLNAGQKLRLSASGTTSVNSYLQWQVDGLDIQRYSYGETEKQVVYDTQFTFNQFYVLPFVFDVGIRANSFLPGATYTVSLSCITGSRYVAMRSAIHILINQPPQPGIFRIDPNSGLELTDDFTFIAREWYSNQLPLFYQFGLFSSDSSTAFLPISLLSEMAVATSVLPRGSNTFYELNCAVVVLDITGSNSSVSKRVRVFPVSNIDTSSKVSQSLFNLDTATVDSSKVSIGVFSTALNRANCSNAPNCSTLNRYPCLDTDHTCGTCEASHYGVAGDANSLCLSIPNRRRLLQRLMSCRSGSDCGLFQHCTSGYCQPLNQSCINSCSGHGRCAFIDETTGLEQKPCNYYDLSCSAVCICRSNFYGVSCDIPAAERIRKESSRCAIVRSMQRAIGNDNMDLQSLTNWISLLLSVTGVPRELSPCQYEVESSIAALLSASDIINPPFEVLLMLASSIDAILSPTTLRGSISSLIRAWSSIVAEDLVVTQSASAIATQFRIVISSLDFANNVTIIEPQSSSEKVLSGYQPQQYTVVAPPSPNEWITISMATFRANLIENDSVNSNTADVYVHAVSSPYVLRILSSSPVYISLKNIDAIDSSATFPSAQFKSICQNNKIERFKYQCPYTPSPIGVNCSGNPGTVEISCPAFKFVSRCLFLNGSFVGNTRYSCRESRINRNLLVSSTTCTCFINSSTVLTSNDLAISLAAQKVAVITSTYSKSITKFTAPVTPSVYGLLTTSMGAFFAILLIGLVVSNIWGHHLANKKNRKISSLDDENSVNFSNELWLRNTHGSIFHPDRTSTVLKSFQLAVPDLYLKPLGMQRLLSALKRHHKYLAFASHGGKIQLQAFCAIVNHSNLVLLSISLCVLALSHWGNSCSNLTTSESCTGKKSLIDSSVPNCEWNAAYNICSAHTPTGSINTMILLIFIAQVASVFPAAAMDELTTMVLWSVCMTHYSKVGPGSTQTTLQDEGKESTDIPVLEISLDRELMDFEDSVSTQCKRSPCNIDKNMFIKIVYSYCSKLYGYKRFLWGGQPDTKKNVPTIDIKVNDFRPAFEVLRMLTLTRVCTLRHLDTDVLRTRMFSMLLFDLLPPDAASVYESLLRRRGDRLQLLYLWQKNLSVLCIVLFNVTIFAVTTKAVALLSGDEQRLLGQSLACWLLGDVLLFTTVVVLCVHVLVPSTIVSDLQTAVEQVQSAAIFPSLVRASSTVKAVRPGTGTGTGSDHPLTAFMPSVRVAMHFPSIEEAIIVSSFNPQKSNLKDIFLSDGSTTTAGKKTFARAMAHSVFARSSLLQDAIFLTVAYCVGGAYLIVCAELYRLSPGLVAVPIVCTATIVVMYAIGEYQTVHFDEAAFSNINASFACVDLFDTSTNLLNLQQKRFNSFNAENFVNSCSWTVDTLSKTPALRAIQKSYEQKHKKQHELGRFNNRLLDWISMGPQPERTRAYTPFSVSSSFSDMFSVSEVGAASASSLISTSTTTTYRRKERDRSRLHLRKRARLRALNEKLSSTGALQSRVYTQTLSGIRSAGLFPHPPPTIPSAAEGDDSSVASNGLSNSGSSSESSRDFSSSDSDSDSSIGRGRGGAVRPPSSPTHRVEGERDAKAAHSDANRTTESNATAVPARRGSASWIDSHSFEAAPLESQSPTESQGSVSTTALVEEVDGLALLAVENAGTNNVSEEGLEVVVPSSSSIHDRSPTPPTPSFIRTHATATSFAAPLLTEVLHVEDIDEDGVAFTPTPAPPTARGNGPSSQPAIGQSTRKAAASAADTAAVLAIPLSPLLPATAQSKDAISFSSSVDTRLKELHERLKRSRFGGGEQLLAKPTAVVATAVPVAAKKVPKR